MNIRVLVIVTVLLVSEPSECVETTTAKMLKVDLFSNLNRQLHSLSGTIFRSLRLGRNFTSTNKVNILVKMADDLIKLSERKFKMYRDVYNATKTDIDNKAIKPLFNLTQVIEEIFKDEHYFLPDNKFLRNNSLIEFYEGVVSNSNWLEKSVIDWENADNKTGRESAKTFRRKYRNEINAVISRRRMGDIRPWVAPIEEKKTRRIFGSTTAKIKKYPFIAALLLMGEFVCAACIISKNMVLTAASCLQLAYKNPKYLDKPEAVAVRVGSDYPNKGGEVTPITAVYFHSKYDPVYLYNNLAIGNLEKSLNFLKAKKSIRRIEYDRDHRDMVDKTELLILGWGDQNSYNTYNGPLTMARLETYNLENCKEIYTSQYVTKTDFCAGFVEQGTGACYRDVGGPGFIGSKLVGIVNFGPPVCGTPNGPTVFTKIGNYASWIDSVLAKSVLKPGQTNETDLKQNKKKPNKAMFNKRSIQRSAIDLLKSLFKDLKIDKLLKGKLNFDDQPDDDSIFDNKTKNPDKAVDDWNDILYPVEKSEEFYATTTVRNALVDKIRSTNAELTNESSKSGATKFTPHELGDLLTLPHNLEDIDPNVVDQLKEIKDILEPIFATPNSPEALKKKLPRGRKTTTSTEPTVVSNADDDDEDETMASLESTIPIKAKNKPIATEGYEAPEKPVAKENEIYDNESDKQESNEYPVTDKKLDRKTKKLFKNWDKSTEEVVQVQSDSDDINASYEEDRNGNRRESTTDKSKKKKNKGRRINEGESPEIIRPDFKLTDTNMTENRFTAMILTGVDNEIKNREMDHYIGEDDRKSDDEPTRRLLQYVNI